FPALGPVLPDRVDAARAPTGDLSGAAALFSAGAARHLPKRHRLARAVSTGARPGVLGDVLYVPGQLAVQEDAWIEPRTENRRFAYLVLGSRFCQRSRYCEPTHPDTGRAGGGPGRRRRVVVLWAQRQRGRRADLFGHGRGR